MNRVRVDVNASDIIDGNTFDISNNPVARALRRYGFREATVGAIKIQWGRSSRPYQAPLPHSVQRFMRKQFNGDVGNPFRFMMPDKGRKI